MIEEIVGSHLKSQRGRGQNQDQTGSSTHEKSLPIIPNVAPPNASAAPGDWQTRPVSSAQAVPTHDGMGGHMPAKLPGSQSPVRPPVKR
jgi:hypothetical protein